MNRKTLWVGGLSLLVVGVAVLTLVFTKPASFRGTSYGEPYPQAAEIELTKSNGGILSSERAKRENCFTLLRVHFLPRCLSDHAGGKLNQVMDKLGDKTKQVQVVFVSVDPERDTPEKIQEYVAHFNENFIGLTGSPDDLQIIWDNYGVFRERVESESAFGYIINHTARTYLIDADGNLRLSYGFQTPVEDMVHDIEILLNQ